MNEQPADGLSVNQENDAVKLWLFTPSEEGQHNRLLGKMRQADKNCVNVSGRRGVRWNRLGMKYDEALIGLEAKAMDRAFGAAQPAKNTEGEE